MKKIIFLCLTTLLALSGFLFACKDHEPPQHVHSFVEHTCQCGEVEKFTVFFESSVGGKIEGETESIVDYGQSTDVKAVADVGYKFTGWSDGVLEQERTVQVTKDFTLTANFAYDFLELPVFVIETENSEPILSKEDYVQCKVSVLNADEKYCFDNYTAQIKGRGNSTWGLDKKPYKLQFVESEVNGKKVNLFGNGKAKTWTLIANHLDLSLSRNALAFEIGSVIDEISDTTSTTQAVEVYLNGSYDGVYLICEQMQTGENRVDIEESLEDGINTGYLIELDYRIRSEGDLGVEYFEARGVPFALKTPDPEDELYSTEFLEYIENYFNQCFDMLEADYDAASTLIDMESFASGYVLHELFKTVDVCYSSFYVHKDKDGLLRCGPIWDFDLSCGNCGWLTNETSNLYAGESNIFFRMLLAHQEFKDLVKEKLIQYRDVINLTIENYVDEVFLYENSYERNFERWDLLGKYGQTDDIHEIIKWKDQVRYLENWLKRSLNYLISVYCV